MTRALTAALSIALGLAVALSAESAEGAPQHVVLILPEPRTPIARRLEAEVMELDAGVHVVDEAVREGEPPSLGELGGRYGAAAVVELWKDGSAVTIWLRDVEPGQNHERVVSSGTGSPDLRSDAIVVGTIELLRVHLEEPPPRVEEPAPERDEPARVVPEQNHGRPLGFGVAIGIDAPSADFSLGSSLEFDLAASLSDALRARAFLRLPVAGSRVEVETASAEVRALLGGVALGIGAEPFASCWIGAELGAGISRLEAQGFSQLPAETRAVNRSAFVAFGGLRASLQLNTAVSLVAGAGVMVSPSPVEVRIDGETIATWGRPGFLGSFGLELWPKLY